MKRRTDGHRALEAWLNDHPKYQNNQRLAEALMCTRAAVSQWWTKNNRPDPVSRMILQDMAGISERLWLERDEKSRLEKYFGTKLHAA